MLLNTTPIQSITNPNPSISTVDLNIVFDGDSLTFGTGATGSQDYPNYIKNKIGGQFKSFTFNSFGVSGQNTQDMISDAPAQIDPLVDGSKTNMIVAWEDVNAILNDGRTAQQNFDDFETYFSGRKTAGFDIGILILGYYPRKKLSGDYNQPTWNDSLFAIQEAYRELVRNSTSNSWDLFVDLTVNPIVGGSVTGEFLNPIYFDDSVHLTTLGYNEIGEWILQNGILKFFKK